MKICSVWLELRMLLHVPTSTALGKCKLEGVKVYETMKIQALLPCLLHIYLETQKKQLSIRTKYVNYTRLRCLNFMQIYRVELKLRMLLHVPTTTVLGKCNLHFGSVAMVTAFLKCKLLFKWDLP